MTTRSSSSSGPLLYRATIKRETGNSLIGMSEEKLIYVAADSMVSAVRKLHDTYVGWTVTHINHITEPGTYYLP